MLLRCLLRPVIHSMPVGKMCMNIFLNSLTEHVSQIFTLFSTRLYKQEDIFWVYRTKRCLHVLRAPCFECHILFDLLQTLSVLVIFCAASLVHPQVNRDSHSQGGPEFVRLVHTRDTLSLHTCLKEWTIQTNKPWIKSMRRCTLIPFYLQREIEWFFFF